jgi:hypothetical protein
MLLTALPPAPPTPKTVIRGFNSRMSGIFKLMLMACLIVARAGSAASPAGPRPIRDVESLARTPSNLSDIAVSPVSNCRCGAAMPRGPPISDRLAQDTEWRVPVTR